MAKMAKNEENRITVRLDDLTWWKLESQVSKGGHASRNELVTQAINYYIDSMNAKENTVLPPAIQSAIDGRIGMFEDRMAKLLYKLTVEMDMGLSMTADVLQADETYLRRLRADSVKNVKATNGLLSLEQRMRDDGDDAWQD